MFIIVSNYLQRRIAYRYKDKIIVNLTVCLTRPENNVPLLKTACFDDRDSSRN